MHGSTSIFNIVWRCLAVRSYVDQYGSAEYWRVLAEWQDAGYPAWTLREVIDHANVSPP